MLDGVTFLSLDAYLGHLRQAAWLSALDHLNVGAAAAFPGGPDV
jgi:hypothetical protein